MTMSKEPYNVYEPKTKWKTIAYTQRGKYTLYYLHIDCFLDNAQAQSRVKGTANNFPIINKINSPEVLLFYTN